MGDKELVVREKVTLARDVAQGPVTHTETIKAVIEWDEGRPSSAEYLGDPTGASNWKIVCAEPIAAVPAAVPEAVTPEEAPPEEAEPAPDAPAEEKMPVGTAVVISRGLKKGQAGKIERWGGDDCAFVRYDGDTREGAFDVVHYSRLALRKDYKGKIKPGPKRGPKKGV